VTDCMGILHYCGVIQVSWLILFFHFKEHIIASGRDISRKCLVVDMRYMSRRDEIYFNVFSPIGVLKTLCTM
jgi:hypothetical protein